MGNKYSNGWFIEKIDGNHYGRGFIPSPISLETVHEVFTFDNLEDYESRCKELGIELENL
ncbi:MAG: hypothetical protein HRT87_01230 [Legionellales bacterium]|nr:hypothetical protein [Legionellales bacterium]